MNSSNTSSTLDERALSAAVGNLAERLERLTGAVDRLTNCLAPLPHEYGPPPPYPLSMMNVLVIEGPQHEELESTTEPTRTASSQTASSDDKDEDASSSSSSSSSDEDDDNSTRTAGPPSETAVEGSSNEAADNEIAIGARAFCQNQCEDGSQMKTPIAGMPTDMLSTRTPLNNQSQPSNDDEDAIEHEATIVDGDEDINGHLELDENRQQIYDKDDDDDDEDACGIIEDDDDNEDDIHTARAVPSQTNLAAARTEDQAEDYKI